MYGGKGLIKSMATLSKGSLTTDNGCNGPRSAGHLLHCWQTGHSWQ